MISTTAVGNRNELLVAFLLAIEAYEVALYDDNADPAQATIGIGFNVEGNAFVRNAVIDRFLRRDLVPDNPQLPFPPPVIPPNDIEHYVGRISAVLGSNETAVEMAERLDAIMAEFAIDTSPLLPPIDTRRIVFEFHDQQEAGNLLTDEILSAYEALVENFLTARAGGDAIDTNSYEYLALLSLAFNSRTGDVNGVEVPTLLGPSLGVAIEAGDHAEGWYEIRYGSNTSDAAGVAKRRYAESAIFDGVGNEEAGSQELFDEFIRWARTLTRHENRINTYDQNGENHRGFGLSITENLAPAARPIQTIEEIQTRILNVLRPHYLNPISQQVAQAVNALDTVGVPGHLTALNGLSASITRTWAASEFTSDGEVAVRTIGAHVTNDLIFGGVLGQAEVVVRGTRSATEGSSQTEAYALNGGAGNDVFVIGSQDTTIDGGEGIDVLSFIGSETAITFNDADAARLTNLEVIVGSNIDGDDITGTTGDDILLLGEGTNTVRESLGNDIIVGGDVRDTYIARELEGERTGDNFFGRRGIDYADYRNITTGVTFTLISNGSDGQRHFTVSRDGSEQIDNLYDVEFVFHTREGDTVFVNDVRFQETVVELVLDVFEVIGNLNQSLQRKSFAAPAVEPEQFDKSDFDVVDFSGLSNGVDSFNGYYRASEAAFDARDLSGQWNALWYAADLGKELSEEQTDTAAIHAQGVDHLILSDHDDVHYFRGDNSIFSEFGRIEGRGGDDTILAYNPGYRLAGQLLDPHEPMPESGEPDLRQRAGEDLFLEIDGGDGDDNLFVVGGAGARVVGGSGQDLIFSWSERSLVWGNEVDTAANQTSQDESDMFWWSPGAFVQDADPVDFVSVFGITLTGGSNFLTKFGQTGGNQVIDSLMWFMGYSSTNSGQLLIHYLKPDLETLSNVMLIEDYDYAGDLGGSADEVFGIVQGGIANGKGDLGLRFRVWKADDGVEISLFNAMWGEIVFWLGQFDTFVKGLNWRSGKDPLVLDLDGDGLETVRMSQSQANFDFDDDFFAERTGWVDSDDGLLAVDRNADGVIDDISELFGGNNPDGIEQTGFAALSDFDSNLDGVVDASDADFDQLLVWRDLDGDGKGESGDADGFGNELFTLEELGISSISTGSTAFDASELVLRSNNSLSGGQRIGVEGHGSGVSTGDTEGGRIIASGATLLSEGSYTRTDGSTGAVYEVIFETDTTRTIYRGNTSLASWNPAIAAGSETGTAINATGRGRSTDLAISAANDPLLSAVIAAQLSQMGVAAGEAPDLATLRDLAA